MVVVDSSSRSSSSSSSSSSTSSGSSSSSSTTVSVARRMTGRNSWKAALHSRYYAYKFVAVGAFARSPKVGSDTICNELRELRAKDYAPDLTK